MAALTPRIKAPDFTLKSATGETLSLKEALSKSPAVLLAFFKVSCPVCQFAFPYIERIHQNNPTIPVWGVSQDDREATKAFMTMYGCTFPMALDEQLSSTVDYDLTNVPTCFLVRADGMITHTVVGFVKDELEAVNKQLAAHANADAKPLFTEADDVPALRPG